MKDNSTALQTAFYDVIDGSISYGGNDIALYDTVPDSPSYPYIQFRDKTGNDRSNKTDFGSTDTVSLSIVDRFPVGTQGSRTRINSVANDMFDLLRPDRTTVNLNPTGFNVVRLIVENDIFLRELSETYLYLSREIRFNLQTEEA